MRKGIILSFLAVFLAVSYSVRAQVPSTNPVNGVIPAVLNAAGGSYDNPSSYYRYEWSFGELLLIQAFAPADSSVLVTQGVLQPCTDKGPSPFIVSFEPDEYKIFPNPTSGKFEVDFFVRLTGQMHLQLINPVGQTIMTRSYHYDGCCRIENFDISHLPSGTYFVVADFVPDLNRAMDNLNVVRHSGLKVVKITGK